MFFQLLFVAVVGDVVFGDGIDGSATFVKTLVVVVRLHVSVSKSSAIGNTREAYVRESFPYTLLRDLGKNRANFGACYSVHDRPCFL